MKKGDKLDLIKTAIENPQLCRCYFTYGENYYYYYPNAVNEKFLLGQEENDFLLDGYCIRRISQLKKAARFLLPISPPAFLRFFRCRDLD